MSQASFLTKVILLGAAAIGSLTVATGRLELLAVFAAVPFLFVAVYRFGAAVVAATWVLLIFQSRLPVALFDMIYFSYVLYFAMAAALVGFMARALSPGKPVMGREIWMLALFVVPVTIGAVRGLGHLKDIPPHMLGAWTDVALDARAYLRTFYVTPMFQPLLALLIAGAVARGLDPLRLIKPGLILVWIFAALLGADVLSSGRTLGELAQFAEEERADYLSVSGLHANNYGLYCVFAYAFMLALVGDLRSRNWRLVFYATMTLSVFVVIITFSRSAFLSLIAVNALHFWRTQLWKKWVFVAISLATVFLVPEALFYRFRLGMVSGDLDVFSSGRVDNIWSPLLYDVRDNFLFGQGHYSIYWTPAQQSRLIYPVGHSHNALIDLLLDYGVFGAAAILAFFAFVWRRFLILARADRDPIMRAIFRGGHLAMPVLAFAATNGRLTPEPIHVFVWIAIGVMLGRLAQLEEANTAGRGRSEYRSRVIGKSSSPSGGAG